MDPQIPKTKARKMSVNDIGKPINITKIIAANIIRPIVGFESPGRDDIISVKASPPGVMPGRKTAITSQKRAIK